MQVLEVIWKALIERDDVFGSAFAAKLACIETALSTGKGSNSSLTCVLARRERDVPRCRVMRSDLLKLHRSRRCVLLSRFISSEAYNIITLQPFRAEKTHTM